MYRLKALMFLPAVLFVLGLTVEANAVTYTFVGDDWSQSFRITPLWQDSLGQSPANDAELDSLMLNASLGAVFQVTNADIGIVGRNAADGPTITVNAPFYYTSEPNDGGHRGMCYKDQLNSSNTYTFNDLYFQGSMDFSDIGNAVHLGGSMQVTGPAEFITSSQAGDTATIDAFMDASRVDIFDIRWYSAKTAYSSEGTVHLNNGDNAFFGTWRLTARLYADVDGCLGDADVLVCGAGSIGTDPNITAVDGRNQGILVLGSSGAISPTAKLELTAASLVNPEYGEMPGKVVVNSGVAASVRQLIIDGVAYPAGTYDFNSVPGRIEGTGTITIADVNATAIMTMECKDHLGVTITGDTGLMPRVGTKGYKPGYAARIRAKSTLAISGAGYTFLKWQVNGSDYSAELDTTVTMDTSKTVTAVYTKLSGASQPAPADKEGAVSVTTGISWTPDPAATTQSVYFGTSTAVYGTSATPIYIGNGSLSSLTNAQLGGTLKESANYYWQVRSNVANDAKPQWVFTTGKVRATTPVPADNASGQATDLTLQWSYPDAGTTSFDVYFGTDRSAVENGLVTPTNVTTPELAKTGLSNGAWYYWRVDCKFPGKTAVGDVWAFRVEALKIYLDTSALTATDESSNPLTGVTTYLDDASIAVFKFDNFSYGQEYDVVVSGTNKLAIWSDNSISFGGVLDVSAPTNDSNMAGPAIAGGYIGGPGVIQQTDATQPNYIATPILYNGAPRQTNYHWFRGDMSYYRDQHPGDANYKPLINDPNNNDEIYGPGRPYAQYNYVVTTDGQYPKFAKDSRSGTGGTYGGHGGNSTKVPVGAPGGHAATYAQNWTRYDASTQNLPGYYGQKELYELWGGSGGDGGFVSLGTTVNANALGGGAGGGVVEMFTKGNLIIGPNAQILSKGGNTTSTGSQRAGGAGSGGSIRLVAAGNLTLSGKLSAEGGKGADNPNPTSTSNYTGPGGGGGRIAIYKGGTLNAAGAVVTVAGGASGRFTSMAANVFEWQSGTSGTVYGLEPGEGVASMITGAHWPIPADGARGIDGGTAELTWLPGLGAATNTVYFGTSTNPPILTSVAGGRARKSVSATVALNTKYYWRVDCDGVPGPLWTFRSAGYEAKNPTPATGSTNVATTSLQLKWQDGYPDPNTITKREVFFGTDQVAVANATTTSPLKIATVTDKNNLVVNLTTLLANTPYYWRVDTYASVTPSYIDGLVWNFTTRPPICRDVIASDFSGDCKVTFVDFALLAANWDKCNLPNPLDCD